MSICARVKHFRETNNFTQYYVGVKLGISQQAYCKLESGESLLNIEHLKVLAELYNIPAYSFFYNEDSEVQRVFDQKESELASLKLQVIQLKARIEILEKQISNVSLNVMK